MLTDKEKSKIKVIETKLKKDELLQEKERLEKRLIEIDMLLKQFENENYRIRLWNKDCWSCSE